MTWALNSRSADFDFENFTLWLRTAEKRISVTGVQLRDITSQCCLTQSANIPRPPLFATAVCIASTILLSPDLAR